MSELTPRQEQILGLIVASVNETGAPPSLMSLCRQTGIPSSLAVIQHVTDLRDMGVLATTPDIDRGITILRDDEIAARGTEWSTR